MVTGERVRLSSRVDVAEDKARHVPCTAHYKDSAELLIAKRR